MSPFAKTLIELHRLVQQSFLNVRAYCSKRTVFNRVSANPSYELEQAIQSIEKQVADLHSTNQSDEEFEMYSSEIQQLEHNAVRLVIILRMIKATEILQQLNSSDEAKIIFEKINADFNELCEKFPTEKEDIEYRTMHMVHTAFVSEVDRLFPMDQSFEFINSTDLLEKSKNSDIVSRVMQEVARLIDEPTLQLQNVDGIDEHEIFSSEKVVSDLSKLDESGESSKDWLDAFKFEKCKVSTRVVKIMEIVRSLFEIVGAGHKPEDAHTNATAIFNIINMFICRAKPVNHHACNDIVYFNDCLFILIEIERYKCRYVYAANYPIFDYNFNDLLVSLRKNACSVLQNYLQFIKSQFLTWSSNAVESFLNGQTNEFHEKLRELGRFVEIWKDICSKNTAKTMIMFVSADILLRTSNSLLEYKNFDHEKCCIAVLLVSEIIERCDTYVEKSMTYETLYKSAVKRLNAVKYCLERSEFDINREWSDSHGQLVSILSEEEVKRLSLRYVKE